PRRGMAVGIRYALSRQPATGLARQRSGAGFDRRGPRSHCETLAAFLVDHAAQSDSLVVEPDVFLQQRRLVVFYFLDYAVLTKRSPSFRCQTRACLRRPTLLWRHRMSAGGLPHRPPSAPLGTTMGPHFTGSHCLRAGWG